MATSGRLKTRVDRLKKKLAEKGSALPAGKKRILSKKLRRFQRAHRTALALEARAANKGKAGKDAAKGAEEKPATTAPEAGAPPAQS